MRKSPGLKTRLAAAAAGAALAGLSFSAAAAQDRPVVLSSSVAPFAAGVRVLGAAPGQARVSFEVVLKLRDYAGLERSNQAGKVLSYAELKARYLPTAEAYDRVLNFLVEKGLRIEATADNRMTIEASGPAAVVSRALGAHFSRIQAEGKQFVAADTAPVLPASIARVVLGLNGLQPNLHAVKMSRVGRYDATTPPFYSQAFVSAYGASGLGNAGQATTTAIVIDVFPLQSDVTAYWTLTGVSQNWGNIKLIQTQQGVMGPPTGEESLDTEIASSVADNSSVRVYASTDLSFHGIDRSFQRIFNDMTRRKLPIQQVSISLGACEKEVPRSQVQTDNHFFALMTSRGASIFVSSGDSGSDTCGDGTATPSFFSTSPNVTAVGGTSLVLNANGRASSETAWDGSGGGLSVYFGKPSYQVDQNLGFKKRAVPDISADGDPNTGALVIVDGAPLQVGGTSLSAPIMAALTARMNSARLQAGKPPLGLLNSRIYGMIGTGNLRDVTEGANGAYSAGPGYDLVTGVGVPLVNHMLPHLVAQP